MEIDEEGTKATEDEHGYFDRSNEKIKEGTIPPGASFQPLLVKGDPDQGVRRLSYVEKVLGGNRNHIGNVDGLEEAKVVSDNDSFNEKESSKPWFSLGMSRSEMVEARKPWQSSVINMLVERKMGYHYLIKRIQSMWKPQSVYNIIDLTADFYIVRFTSNEDYNDALLNSP